MGRVSAELGRRVYLDANIFIYAVEGFAAHAASIQALLAAMDAGEVVAVTSELTVAEVTGQATRRSESSPCNKPQESRLRNK